MGWGANVLMSLALDFWKLFAGIEQHVHILLVDGAIKKKINFSAVTVLSEA